MNTLYGLNGTGVIFFYIVDHFRVSTNTVGKKLNPQMVNYYLYMSGGFVAYNAGDRVRVLPPQDLPIELTDNNSLEDNDESDDESSDQQSIVDKTEFGKPKKVLYVAKPVEKIPYNGEIIGAKRCGELFVCS